MGTIAARFLLAVVPFVLIGCEAPVITVHHALPAALPLDGRDWHFQATSFTASSICPQGAIAEKDAADLLMQGFTRRQPAPAGQVSAPTGQLPIAWVSGQFGITVTDTAGRRIVRLRDVQTGQLETRELPTLVRRAQLRVDFEVRSRPDSPPLGVVEVRHEYDSVVDPNVLGMLGLERPDDPQRVPAVGEILRSLSADCVGEFFELVRPLEIVAGIPLQPVSDAEARAGLEAAETGRYPDAAERLEKALAANPGDLNARFNLAAVAEAAGDLAKARANYQLVLEGTEAKHPLHQHAAEGLARVERVLLSRAALRA